MHPSIVLHTSCLLEPPEDFRALLSEAAMWTVVFPKDVLNEILFLANTAEIPRIRRNAELVKKLNHYSDPDITMRDLCDPVNIREYLSPAQKAPIIFAFYSAGI